MAVPAFELPTSWATRNRSYVAAMTLPDWHEDARTAAPPARKSTSRRLTGMLLSESGCHTHPDQLICGPELVGFALAGRQEAVGGDGGEPRRRLRRVPRL